jgi:hypothetical protein
MADATTAILRGFDYQALMFWMHAARLLAPESRVARVTYEADGPKAFDDVVVDYDPPIVSGGSDRVRTAYFSSKWRTRIEERFGCADLSDPQLIGATKVSLLERLRDAQQNVAPAGTGVRFALVTTARIRDNDPLGGLISNYDRAFLVDLLFDGTTDKSQKGQIRKAWREHLKLDDAGLRLALTPLQVFEAQPSTMELVDRLNDRLRSVDLAPIDPAHSHNPYADLVHKLKGQGRNTFDPKSFAAMCREEGLLMPSGNRSTPAAKRLAIRSFIDPGENVEAGADKTLLLTAEFQKRYIAADDGWRLAIQPKVIDFLTAETKDTRSVHLTFDAHASIAYLAGMVLHAKRGINVELAQRTRVGGSQRWRASDAIPSDAPDLTVQDLSVAGGGHDIALAIGISNPVLAAVQQFIAKSVPSIGRILVFEPHGGPSQNAVRSGGHAVRLAETIVNAYRAGKTPETGAVHVFASCPNALLFYLGQQARGLGASRMYEYDFDQQRHKTYQLSLSIDGDLP